MKALRLLFTAAALSATAPAMILAAGAARTVVSVSQARLPC